MHIYSSNVAGLQFRFPTSSKTDSNKNVAYEYSKIVWTFSKKRSKMQSFY